MKKIKVLSLVLAVAMFACLLIPVMNVSAAGTAYTYYLSENGNDEKDGLSEANALVSVGAVMKKIFANTYAEGDTVKVIVIGDVLHPAFQMTFAYNLSSTSSGGANNNHGKEHTALLCVRDGEGKPVKNEDGTVKMIPFTVEGKDSTSKITFDLGNESASRKFCHNEMTFKNITFTTKYTAGSSWRNYVWLGSVNGMTFDGCKFDTSAEWEISTSAGNSQATDSMQKAGAKMNNFVKFLNGDYTNLSIAASVWHTNNEAYNVASSDLKNSMVNNTLIVGAGAKMGKVIVVGNAFDGPVTNGATVIVENGGEVATIEGNKSGTSTAQMTRQTEVKILVKAGGKVGTINATGDYVNANANITIDIESGATVTTVTELGTGAVKGDGVTVTVNRTASTPTTADASQIVLFSFVAIAALAGVVVLKKTRA